MASRGSSSKSETGHLESLDDLLSRPEGQEQSPSSLLSLRSDYDSSKLRDEQEEGDDSLDSIVVHSDEPSSSAVTIKAASAAKPAKPRDEARWNGFHLWRTESHNLRAEREVATLEAQRARERQGWMKEFEEMLKSWCKRASNAFSGHVKDEETKTDEGDLSRSRMFLLTLVLAGAQLAWCLEFGYGNPYLLSLGLSKASTSLVWLAAPISGLMQPVVGVLSDLSTSQYRRRQYIIAALTVLSISTLVLAFSHPISSALVDVFQTGLADWDPARKEALAHINRFVAVVSFIILDLSINSLQAASRALILDTAPTSQHSRANAWQGRMTHAGNVVGYAVGWCNLSSSVLLSWLGGDQFRKYAVVSVLGLVSCSLITCFAIKEQPREPMEGSTAIGFFAKMKEATYHIWQSLRRLPRPVRRICLVQLFAFMGWFPFLFYASQWVIEIRQGEKGTSSSGSVDDEAAEKGSFALLMFATVSLVSGTVLPYFALSNSSNSRSIYLSGLEGESLPDGDDAFTQRQAGKPSRKSWKLTLRTIWTISLVLYSLQAAVLTFAVQTTKQAIVLLASIGIPWAVACWVPFALVMESVREAEDGMSPFEFEADWFAPERVRGRRESSSAFARERVNRAVKDCEPLVNSSDSSTSKPRQPSSFLARGTELVSNDVRSPSRQTARQASTGVPIPSSNQNDQEGATESLGGTVLGIHNLAIVLPQLVVALLASLILRTRSAQHDHGLLDDQNDSSNGVGVVWVIRMGGVAAIFAAILTRFVPLTRTERQLRGDQGANPVTGPEPRYDDEASENDEEDEQER
ncbi:hypothetical protein CBS101457_004624 [Exobasidium rhododendri]|nr:hypothetical protein CBS101457_004624 [Exobasidium rhododendri]